MNHLQCVITAASKSKYWKLPSQAVALFERTETKHVQTALLYTQLPFS